MARNTLLLTFKTRNRLTLLELADPTTCPCSLDMASWQWNPMAPVGGGGAPLIQLIETPI